MQPKIGSRRATASLSLSGCKYGRALRLLRVRLSLRLTVVHIQVGKQGSSSKILTDSCKTFHAKPHVIRLVGSKALVGSLEPCIP